MGTYDAVMRVMVSGLTVTHRLLHRITGGRASGRIPGGGQLVWLAVPGRKSGLVRTVPLLAVQDGTGADAPWVITGSNGGRSVAPAWVLNLRADPHAVLDTGSGRFAVRGEEVADEAERVRLYAALTGVWSGYRGYARRTGRRIPVFRLHSGAAAAQSQE